MNSTPKAAEPLIREFAGAFTRPTYRRFVVLLLAAILTTGRRTATNLLRTVSAPAPGHPSSYHRVLSRRRWSSWRLARALAEYTLRHWVPDGFGGGWRVRRDRIRLARRRARTAFCAAATTWHTQFDKAATAIDFGGLALAMTLGGRYD